MLLTVLSAALAISATPFVAGAALERRGVSTCTFSGLAVTDRYQITIDNGQDMGVCNGLLDNLHGACGEGITDWHCEGEGNGPKKIWFNAPQPPFCKSEMVQDAIWLATEPHVGGVTCYWEF